LNAFKQERAASAGSIREGLMLSKTVRVPRHVELSEPGWRRTRQPLVEFFAKAMYSELWKFGNRAVQGQTKQGSFYGHAALVAYYFGHLGKSNFFFSESIGWFHFPAALC
jgi:hypothetical protein